MQSVISTLAAINVALARLQPNPVVPNRVQHKDSCCRGSGGSGCRSAAEIGPTRSAGSCPSLKLGSPRAAPALLWFAGIALPPAACARTPPSPHLQCLSSRNSKPAADRIPAIHRVLPGSRLEVVFHSIRDRRSQIEEDQCQSSEPVGTNLA
jgi:hypothetical protein